MSLTTLFSAGPPSPENETRSRKRRLEEPNITWVLLPQIPRWSADHGGSDLSKSNKRRKKGKRQRGLKDSTQRRKNHQRKKKTGLTKSQLRKSKNMLKCPQARTKQSMAGKVLS